MRSFSKGGDLLVIYYSVFGTKRMPLCVKRGSCFMRVSLCKSLSSLPSIKSFVFFFFSFLTVKVNQMLLTQRKIKRERKY